MSGSNERLTKKELAAKLGVSRSSLYYRHKLPEKDEQLRQRIQAEMELNSDAGSRPVALALGINRKRARRVMGRFGLKPVRRAKAPRKESDQEQPEQDYPCVTKLWSPVAPNVIWVSDFTFIPFHGRFVYLATIMDGFTGEVLAATVMTSHNTELILRTIQEAVQREGQLPEWFHSDQGSEYTSDAVTKLLIKCNVKISMSPKSSPWRNAMQESFYGRFKVALGDTERFNELTQLVEYLYQLVHRFTHIRIKNRLGMTPHQFRLTWEQQRIHILQRISTTYQSPSPEPPPSGDLLQLN